MVHLRVCRRNINPLIDRASSFLVGTTRPSFLRVVAVEFQISKGKALSKSVQG